MYRRIRYIRYKRTIRRKLILENKHALTVEKAEIRRKQKEFRREELIQQRLKAKAEKEQARIYKTELKAELKEQKKKADEEIKRLATEVHKKKRFQKELQKRKSRRLIKHCIRIQSRKIRHLPMSINASNFKRFLLTISETSITIKNYLVISFNSTVLFILSYLTLFLIAQAVTVMAASFFDYPTTVYYYEVYFIISPDDWYHDSVKTIFSAGPLVNLVIGITFLIIYSNIREKTGPFKLFFLWGYLHAVNMLFGAMLIGTLFETGVGHVISWMYIMDTGRVMYSIISIFFLVVAGFFTTQHFLISGNSYFKNISDQNRYFFITAQALMPYILGNAFLIAIRLPRFIYYDTFVGFTIILSIIPVLLACKTYNILYFEEEDKKFRIAWLNALVLAIIIFVFRGVLEIGLHFGS